MLVTWGTTKLLQTRGSSNEYRTDIKGEDSDTWTFGQILPVLLLAAPIWSLIGAFVFDDRSERLPHPSQAHGNYLIAASTPAPQVPSLHELVTDFPAPSVVNAGGPRAAPIETAAIFTANRYIHCCWIGPCLAFPCFLIVSITYMQFYAVAGPSKPPIMLWITDLGMIYVIVLVYPLAFQCTILLGLVYEEGFIGDRSSISHSKACQPLLWPAMFIIWVFFLLLWFIYTSFGVFLLESLGSKPLPPNSRYGVTLGGTTVIHLIYAMGYLWQVFRKRSRLG